MCVCVCVNIYSHLYICTNIIYIYICMCAGHNQYPDKNVGVSIDFGLICMLF